MGDSAFGVSRVSAFCRSIIGTMLLATIAVVPATSEAQEDAWPSRTIRIIVPTSPGGINDFLGRALARFVQPLIKQAIVIDNKPGANTTIAAEATKNAAPDGYTFFVGSVSSHSANPALFSKLGYDPEKDFVEVGMFGLFPYLALVRKDSPYQSLAAIISAARANPGKLTYGYGASSSQVPSELLKARAGINIVGVPYKASPQVLTDIAAGTIDFAIIDAGSSSPVVKGGLLRAIAITSLVRSPLLPDVGTAAETLPGYEYQGWAGLSAPARTSASILARMNDHMRNALADPGVKKDIEQQGLIVRATTLAEQAEFVLADRKRWAEWVRMANIPKID